MNLYIINDILCDYTSGMVVIAASSKDECREFFVEEFSWDVDTFDKIARFIVIEGVNCSAGIVDYVYGGG